MKMPEPPEGRSADRKSIYLVLITALLFAAAAAVLVYFHINSSAGNTALVYQDGRLIRKIDLSAVTQDYTFEIKTADGGCNTIRVTKGAIGVVDANCPDRICQKMGMVSRTNHPISCLPHKLVILIEHSGTDETDDVDAVIQ